MTRASKRIDWDRLNAEALADLDALSEAQRALHNDLFAPLAEERDKLLALLEPTEAQRQADAELAEIHNQIRAETLAVLEAASTVSYDYYDLNDDLDDLLRTDYYDF